ncbi:hypothetical protein BHE90_014457 [Fusarium euwallaceae]|uniref:Major facilitator superfamily (MFS) profile domain-containing protein n=1 Tax=Fusarium euwallaceae TaxID=1147111 RepID=A0A430L5W6_9HYPO|nr:hypothetical protein BHE90_014457 [Fusarium euwallaceae]
MALPAWVHDKGLRSLYLWLPVVILSSSYQGFDGMIMNGLQLLPSWQEEFNYPKGPVLGLLNSIQTVGAMIALPAITPVVDKFGRRKSIFFGAAWTIAGAILQASSKQIPQFVISRFLIGFGLAFTVVGAPLLLAELALPKHRGAIISYYPTCWYLGAIIAAWVTYGTHKIDNAWSWRIPSLLQGVPASLQLLLIWFVPESPRWLISKGRGKEARDILVRHHANGNERSSLVDLEYAEIKESIESDASVKAKTGWLDLVRTAGNRRRLIIVFFAGLFIEISGNGLVQYYLHSVLLSIGITNTTTQVTINGCLSIYNFVLASIAALFVERVVFTTHGTSGYAIGVLVAIFLSNGAYDIGWTPLWAYPAEVLSYNIRARGVTFQTGIMHAFGFFGTFVNPIGLQNVGWRYYIAYIVYTFLELLVVWYFFVETKGFTLEEIAVIFDTEGLSWKQRRNMKPIPRSSDSLVASESGDLSAKNTAEATEKRVSDDKI